MGGRARGDLGKVTPSAGHAGFVALLSIGGPRDFFSIHASYVEHIDTPCGTAANKYNRAMAANYREHKNRRGGSAPCGPGGHRCHVHHGNEALCHADASTSYAACLAWQASKATS
jgi:hypothetical protein